MPKVLEKNMDAFRKNEVIFTTTYEVFSFFDYINICVSQLLKNNIKIKKCENCGKFFIPINKSNEIFCNNKSPQNPKKTCRDIGSNEKKKILIKKTNSIEHEHHNTKSFYNTKKYRARKNGDIKALGKINNVYEKYKMDFNKKLKKYNNKKMTEEDFVKWIIEQRNIEK